MCSWKSVIKKCNSELQQLLNLNCLTPVLYKEGLLTDQEQQELAKEAAVPCKQNSHFVQTILPFKGEQPFKKFLKVLENDKQHCGHKELFERLSRHYRTGNSSTPGTDNESERINLLSLGKLINDAVKDQVKELITLQKKHEEQEQNRHKAILHLINKLINQQQNSNTTNAEEGQRRISVISNATSLTTSSAVDGSCYSADCEESDTYSVHSGDYSNFAEDAKPIASNLCSPEDEQLPFPEDIGLRPRAKSLSSTNRVKEHRSASRSYSSINVNNRELLKPPNNSRKIHQEQGHSRSHSLPRKTHHSKTKENHPLQKLGPSSLTQGSMASNSCKLSHEESVSSNILPEGMSTVTSIMTAEAKNTCNTNTTIYDHEATNTSVSNSINNGPSMVTLNIQSATDDDDDDDDVNNLKKECRIVISDKATSPDKITNPLSSLTDDLKLPMCSANKKEESDVLCIDSPIKKRPIPVTCQFTIGDPTKQQQVYCQEKDGMVYFISWMDKQTKHQKISKLGVQHDAVITYDPSTNITSPPQFICCRINTTHAFAILNFKNRITLVAGDNPKFLDGSVYLYQLVEYKKYQRAFKYKWSEMAKSVRSCSPVLASPTHAIYTATDDCILICLLNNNSNNTLKALSINVYNEACIEEDTKWKVVSLGLPTTLLNKVGHLTSGTVHQKTLYLSIRTSEGFGTMQVSIAELDHPEIPTGDIIGFHTVIEDPSNWLTTYFLFDYSHKLCASSVTKGALSCSIGSVTFANSSVKQSGSIVSKIPVEDAQLHYVISLPNCVLVLVYYSPHLQSYILNSIGSSVL